MSFVLDTGSAWMWVPGFECKKKECSGRKYKNFLSKTFRSSSRKMDLRYGVGYLEGHVSQDQVSLVKQPTSVNQLAQKIDFLNVFHARELHGLVSDGLIGMAPHPPPNHPADIFVNELYSQGVIKRNVFTLYFGNVYEG